MILHIQWDTILIADAANRSGIFYSREQIQTVITPPPHPPKKKKKKKKKKKEEEEKSANLLWHRHTICKFSR